MKIKSSSLELHAYTKKGGVFFAKPVGNSINMQHSETKQQSTRGINTIAITVSHTPGIYAWKSQL